MRVLHVKLGEVSLQQRGRGLLGLQGGVLPLEMQDPTSIGSRQLEYVLRALRQDGGTAAVRSEGSPVPPGRAAGMRFALGTQYLLARDSTLVLFLTRCRGAVVFPTSVWGSVVTCRVKGEAEW